MVLTKADKAKSQRELDQWYSARLRELSQLLANNNNNSNNRADEEVPTGPNSSPPLPFSVVLTSSMEKTGVDKLWQAIFRAL